MHVPASRCVCPGKTPPWSLTFTCTAIPLPEQGVELWMEKVTSPSWLAGPGLNACPTSASEGLFPAMPMAPCHSAGWEVAVLGWGWSVEETPPVERNSCEVGSVCQVLHWSSEARTGGCQLCQGWAATQSGPTGTVAAPMSQGAGTLPTCAWEW